MIYLQLGLCAFFTLLSYEATRALLRRKRAPLNRWPKPPPPTQPDTGTGETGPPK